MTKDDLIAKTELFHQEIPYSFISYSHHEADQQIVWRDLAVLDQTYNIWQDTKDINYTKTWTNNTGEVIKNNNCLMLIFYVSKNSLRSPNCLPEIQLIETQTDLNLILVEAEPGIEGSLRSFIDSVFAETMNDTEIPSDDRQKMLETIIEYKKLFERTGRFDQSRVPYSAEPTESYYKLLTRNLPEESKKPLKPQPLSSAGNHVNQEILYPNGDHYTGEIKETDQPGKVVPHGIGKMQYFDGFEYIGEWKNGQKDGMGKLVYPEGNPRQILYYSGEWSQDKKNGIGMEVYTEVRKTDYYLGSWKNDKKDGTGFSSYRDGSSKWDEWKNGDRSSRTTPE